MRKRSFLNWLAILVMLFIPYMVMAAEDAYLVLTQKDGQVYKFSLASNPIITFEGTQLVITCGSQRLETSLEQVLNWSHNYETSGVDQLEMEPQSPKFSFGEAIFEGLKSGTQVCVYSIDGKMLKRVVVGNDGNIRLHLSKLGKGAFIIRTPNKSFKVVN